MGSCESGKILTVLSFLVCVFLSDLSVHVQSEIASQTVTVEQSGGSREVRNSVATLAVESGGKEKEKEEEGVGEMPQPSHGHADQGARERFLGARNVDDDGNEDDEEDGQETVQFMAVISERETYQRPTPCSSFLQHQRPLTFDTITTTPTTTPSLHYNPHSSTFIAPVNGLFLFSVKIQLRTNPKLRQLADVHIVTTETDALKKHVVCSISSQHGGGARDFLDSLSRELYVDYRDDLNFATWDFEKEFQERMRKNTDWDNAPRSVWKEVNGETEEVEGFCEGVKHLRQGQRVFVLIGNVDDDNGDRKNVDGSETSSREGDDKNVEDCDIVGGYFSGSLLTKDI